MRKTIKCKSGLTGWWDRLRKNYRSLRSFETWNEDYGLAERFGFKTAREAWDANPLICGSTIPTDACSIPEPIKINMVMDVYRGKVGCMCGCNGRYWITNESRAAATKDRGYGYDDKDVNPNQVQKIIDILNVHLADAEDFGSGIAIDLPNVAGVMFTHAIYWMPDFENTKTVARKMV